MRPNNKARAAETSSLQHMRKRVALLAVLLLVVLGCSDKVDPNAELKAQTQQLIEEANQNLAAQRAGQPHLELGATGTIVEGVTATVSSAERDEQQLVVDITINNDSDEGAWLDAMFHCENKPDIFAEPIADGPNFYDQTPPGVTTGPVTFQIPPICDPPALIEIMPSNMDVGTIWAVPASALAR